MPLMRPTLAGAAGVPRSPPSHRYSSRGSDGRAGGGDGDADRPARQRAPRAALRTGTGTARDPMLVAQSSPMSPATPAWISSRWAGGRPAARSPPAGPAPRDSQRRLGRIEREHRDLVLGQLERDRLVGVFEIDHLGHQPAAIDGVVQVVLVEDHADRVLAGVDAVGAMQMADDLDDRIELGRRAARGCP